MSIAIFIALPRVEIGAPIRGTGGGQPAIYRLAPDIRYPIAALRVQAGRESALAANNVVAN